ncbi:MAG: ABC-type transport auxiliary lipoprotein family protein [Desulfuromonadales bacterium]|jgi:hypothetical protein
MTRYSFRKRVQWCLVLVAVLLLAGCLSRSAPKVTYYSLMTMEQLGGTEALASLPEAKLGIGPVTIPDSLKRSQIATRQQGNRYTFAEFNRWAGVLEKDISSVLGDNLGQLLGIEKVGFFPWLHHFKPTYRVVVDVIRFDGSLEGEAVLSARWAIADADGKDYLAGKKSDYSQPLADASYAALIKAESQLLAALSKEIAAEIVALQK